MKGPIMSTEGILKEVAEKVYMSVDEIKKLICDDRLAHDNFAKEALLTEREVYLIKKMLMKAALRTFQATQKPLKKECRSKNDTSRLIYKKWMITTLFREYAKLRGKDPKVHSLDKWDGQKFY